MAVARGAANHQKHDKRAAPPEDLLVLFVLYLLCHGGILFFPQAYFWDDWISYDVPFTGVLNTLRELGSPFNFIGYLHASMLLIGPWTYKILTFSLFFISGVALNGILSRQPFLTRENRMLVLLLFLVLPFNSSRIANQVFQYTLAHCLFYLAWFSLGRHRILPLLLFAVSFTTSSFLVFYALPVAELFYRRGAFSSISAFTRVLVRHLDFIALPFLVFAIDTLVFPPTGAYQGYNALTGLSQVWPALRVAVWETGRFAASLPLLWAILLAPGVLYALHRQRVQTVPETGGTLLVFIGFAALVLASFPYLAVGHPPHFWVWQSRHQLLLPLGAALFMVGLVNVRTRSWAGSADIKLAFIALLAGASIAYMLGFYGSALVEWQKKKEVMRQLALHPELKGASLILFDDRTEKALNIEGRLYPAYEWHGLLRAAFGDSGEHRWAIAREQYPLYTAGKFDSQLRLYGAPKHARNSTQQPVVVVVTRECEHTSGGCKPYHVLPRIQLEVKWPSQTDALSPRVSN